MKRLAFLMLALSGASHADDPFARIDPDVADVFLGTWYLAGPNTPQPLPVASSREAAVVDCSFAAP